jgi:outer membrane protein insertion porin family
MTDGKIVKAIEVKGNKTISLATILSKIKTRVGQEYMQSVISDDLKRLYNTGYFSDVRVDREDFEGGLKVIIYLEEKSIIDEVTFSKTRYIPTRTLKDKIKTKEGKFLDPKVVRDDINTIKELYAKKGLTMAEVDTETFQDEITNKVSVHFIIREGYRVIVSKINVDGNAAFKDKKIRSLLKTKKKGWFNSGYLKEDVLEEDMERVASFYEQNGFIDVAVNKEIEYLKQGRIEVNINVDEGKRYFVGDIELQGNDVISDKEILKAMKEINEGGVFSREKLSVDITNIRTLYFDRGYIFADVGESASIDPQTGKVNLDLRVKEGALAYIERVKIEGNTRTRDIVIRRELKLQPGDRFDGEKLRKSKERLQNLGYFDDISFDIEDTDNYDRKNLVVQVKEAKTGTFSFGGGFSTVDQVVGFVEVEQRNFDITNWPTFTGGGQRLQLRAETGSTRNNLFLSFDEPWLFDYPVSFGFDAYKTSRERERDIGYAYDEERLGGALRLGKQLGDNLTGGLSYRREEVTIENFEDNVSADLLAEGGSNILSELGFTLNHDTRDNVFNPAKGHLATGSFDLAGGILGGDKDFYRLQLRGSQYWPLMWDSVLEGRIRTGWVNAYGDSSKVPIFERFFAGGARTIRGYDERKVGPLDQVTGDPIGGEALFVGNIEYTIPVIEFVKFATFFDIGNVWADVEDFGTGELKMGAGVGLRVKTPIGPVQLDYGYPLSEEEGEEERSGKFYFSVSRGF